MGCGWREILALWLLLVAGSAAHMLDQILKTHQEGLHKLPMGRRPLMEYSLLVRLKRQITPTATTLPFLLCIKGHEGGQVFLPLPLPL